MVATKNYYYTFEDLFPVPSDKKAFRELVIKKEKIRFDHMPELLGLRVPYSTNFTLVAQRQAKK